MDKEKLFDILEGEAKDLFAALLVSLKQLSDINDLLKYIEGYRAGFRLAADNISD